MKKEKKTKIQSYSSEYCMSAGDNAVSRERIDASLTSSAAVNEHTHRKEIMKGFETE